jgi:hypothetical protein
MNNKGMFRDNSKDDRVLELVRSEDAMFEKA